MKRIAKWLGVSSAIAAAAVAIVLSFQRDTGIDPLDDSQIELKNSIDGTTYILTHEGRLYREDTRSRKWYYQDTVNQPEEMARAYVQEGGVTYRFDAESGKRIAVRREFSESFEDLDIGVGGLRQMIVEKRAWGSLTLQSPLAREVPDYVA